jgi:hypothetical protein
MPGARLEILTAPTKNIFNDLHEERIDVGIALESEPERVPAGCAARMASAGAARAIPTPRPERSTFAGCAFTASTWPTAISGATSRSPCPASRPTLSG